MKIEFAEIQEIVKLGQGSQGVIYKVPACVLNSGVTMPGDFAIKKYKKKVIEGNENAIETYLNSLVENRRVAPAPVKEIIDKYTVWPRLMIYENDAVCGFAMKLIPDKFFSRYEDVTGEEITESTLDFCYNDDKTRADLGLPIINAAGRAKIIYDLIRIVSRLHSYDFVLGDLSPNNILVYVDADSQSRNQVLLIDTDAIRKTGHTHPFKQPHTPNWYPPESWTARQECIKLERNNGDDNEIIKFRVKEFIQNFQTDIYKISLAILRLYHNGSQRTSVTSSSSAMSRLKKEISSDFAALIERGLAEEPSQRPTAKEMYLCFGGAMRNKSTAKKK